jgi:hypothetical protein
MSGVDRAALRAMSEEQLCDLVDRQQRAARSDENLLPRDEAVRVRNWLASEARQQTPQQQQPEASSGYVSWTAMGTIADDLGEEVGILHRELRDADAAIIKRLVALEEDNATLKNLLNTLRDSMSGKQHIKLVEGKANARTS